MKDYICTITVDTNDADYVSRSFVVTEAEKQEIEKSFNEIKFLQATCRGSIIDRRTPTEMYGLDEFLVETINELCPSGEYGFHTIKSVSFWRPAGEEIRIDVNTRWYCMH